MGRAAQEDPAVARYLAAKENLFTVTVDASTGVARVWQVKVEPGPQVTVRVLTRVPMNAKWLELFRQSL